MSTKRTPSTTSKTSNKMVSNGETHGYRPKPNRPAAVRPAPPQPPTGQGGGSKK